MAAPAFQIDRRTFFTSDTHFGHEDAMAKYGRPFANAAEMDRALVDAINREVGPGDRLIHLGDFAGPLLPKRERIEHAARIRRRLRCREIHLVAGNHDPVEREAYRELFASIGEIVSLKGWPGGRHRLVLCHYPMRTWQGRAGGAIHLYGHAHAALAQLGRSCDVGVDAQGFRPIAADPLLESLASLPIDLEAAV